MTIEDRLHELGIELTEVFPPAGQYVGAVRTGSLVFLSGAGPIRPDGTFVTGKVGRDVDLDAAKEAARLTGLQLLAILRAELGSLDRVARVVKTLGMVNCAPGFNRTPAVIDGCSELLIDVFGDAGRGVLAPGRSGVVPPWPSGLPAAMITRCRSRSRSRRAAGDGSVAASPPPRSPCATSALDPRSAAPRSPMAWPARATPPSR